MRMKLVTLALVIALILVGSSGWQASMAQEEEYILAHKDVFGNLRRPQVVFSHENHVESLEDGGCGQCHHAMDEQTGELAYVEGDERSCLECHEVQKDDDVPALREAYHENCTGCHRDQRRSGNLNSGPTTCGGCHRKT